MMAFAKKPVAGIALLVSAFALSACVQGMASDSSMDAGMQSASMDGSGSVNVGGNAMLPSRDIVSNAVNSEDHTTLVAAVQEAGLVETLQSPGPFTVFAPTNAAFGKLPEGTVASLLQPSNRDQLTTILTYHVVPGRMTADDLVAAIMDGDGMATMETVAGETLTFEMNGPMNVVARDNAGQTINISTYDVLQSNGVIHVVDTVMLPSS